MFGWSYPPGCSGPPDDNEVIQLRCKHCKSFIGGEHTLEKWECAMECKGDDSDGMCGGPEGKHNPHKVIWDQGVTKVFTCKRCKTVNRFSA